VPRWEEKRDKQETGEITLDEIKMAINSLKNWKAHGTDGIPANLLRYGIKIFMNCDTPYGRKKSFRRIEIKL